MWWKRRGVRRCSRSCPRRRRICRLLGGGQDSICYGALGLGLLRGAIVARIVGGLRRRLGRRAPRVGVPRAVVLLCGGAILRVGVVRARGGWGRERVVGGVRVVAAALSGGRVRPVATVLRLIRPRVGIGRVRGRWGSGRSRHLGCWGSWDWGDLGGRDRAGAHNHSGVIAVGGGTAFGEGSVPAFRSC